MANILDIIVDNKKREVEAKYSNGLYDCYKSGFIKPAEKTISFSHRLANDPIGIIAEFKRRSPSRGDIHPMAIASEIIPEYVNNGAACCSILTDTPFFGGSLDDFSEARQCAPTQPLLRKEFIIDPMQILEAAFFGANAILLIASILSFDEIIKFTDYAHSLNLEVLLELHGKDELDKIIPDVDMIGVNIRNLSTFVTGMEMSDEMIRHLPENTVKVAESGLSDINQINALRAKGYRGFLIGESFMKHKNPGNALKNFINATH